VGLTEQRSFSLSPASSVLRSFLNPGKERRARGEKERKGKEIGQTTLRLGAGRFLLNRRASSVHPFVSFCHISFVCLAVPPFFPFSHLSLSLSASNKQTAVTRA